MLLRIINEESVCVGNLKNTLYPCVAVETINEGYIFKLKVSEGLTYHYAPSKVLKAKTGY